jgi:CNT family concentrative nucleoside transporter
MHFMNLSGIIILLIIAWLLSNNKRVINWRALIWGISLQMVFALFIFVVPAGTTVFLFINDLVLQILDSAQAGVVFLFGRLALPPGTVNEAGETSLGFFLVFQALPTIIFFAALLSVLYYTGIMNRIIQAFAYVFTRLMKVSGAESLCAASNIFVGIESTLVIRPFLKRMTRLGFRALVAATLATLLTACVVGLLYSNNTILIR